MWQVEYFVWGLIGVVFIVALKNDFETDECE